MINGWMIKLIVIQKGINNMIIKLNFFSFQKQMN